MYATTAHQILVDGPEFWASLQEDIANAEHSICIQTLTFEGDLAGTALADALIACRAPRRRVLIDSFNLYFQRDRFVYAPANLRASSPVRAEAQATREMIARLRSAGVEVRYTNPAGVFMHKLLARDHKKLVLIDGDIAYIGGINFCDHNFDWHDMMIRVSRTDVASTLATDFNATWNGLQAPAATRSGDIEILNLDGSGNEVTCRRLLSAIDEAQSSVEVLSPYMTFPFTDALRAAVQRGVRVVVVSPAENNRGFLTTYMRAEATRSGFDLRLYQGRMSHLKGMLIDNAELIIGSSNFDWLTYHLLGEVMAVVTNAGIIEEFRRRVLAPDIATSVPAAPAPTWRAVLFDAAFRIAATVACVLCKPAPRPVALDRVRLRGARSSCVPPRLPEKRVAL
ncbi:MAG: phospholipase D-like domain-containing protein [Longimicrobiales bacterium]